MLLKIQAAQLAAWLAMDVAKVGLNIPCPLPLPGMQAMAMNNMAMNNMAMMACGWAKQQNQQMMMEDGAGIWWDIVGYGGIWWDMVGFWGKYQFHPIPFGTKESI